MTDDMTSWFQRWATPVWGPAAEEGSGGDTAAEASSEATGDEGKTQTAETVLGGDRTDDKSQDAQKDDEAAKTDDKAKDEKSDKKDDGKDDKDNEDAETDGADEVPEDGVYEFELPEGVDLDDEKRDLWSKQFKEIGLTRAQAKALVAAQSEQAIADQKAYADFLEKQQAEHLAAAKADKAIGGDKWDESARLAKLGLEALGGEAIKELILASGNGNNPEMIRELRRIGEMVKDDKFDAGSSHEAPVEREKSWYGETTPDTKKG